MSALCCDCRHRVALCCTGLSPSISWMFLMLCLETRNMCFCGGAAPPEQHLWAADTASCTAAVKGFKKMPNIKQKGRIGKCSVAPTAKTIPERGCLANCFSSKCRLHKSSWLISIIGESEFPMPGINRSISILFYCFLTGQDNVPDPWLTSRKIMCSIYFFHCQLLRYLWEEVNH